MSIPSVTTENSHTNNTPAACAPAESTACQDKALSEIAQKTALLAEYLPKDLLPLVTLKSRCFEEEEELLETLSTANCGPFVASAERTRLVDFERAARLTPDESQAEIFLDFLSDDASLYYRQHYELYNHNPQRYRDLQIGITPMSPDLRVLRQQFTTGADSAPLPVGKIELYARKSKELLKEIISIILAHSGTPAEVLDGPAKEWCAKATALKSSATDEFHICDDGWTELQFTTEACWQHSPALRAQMEKTRLVAAQIS